MFENVLHDISFKDFIHALPWTFTFLRQRKTESDLDVTRAVAAEHLDSEATFKVKDGAAGDVEDVHRGGAGHGGGQLGVGDGGGVQDEGGPVLAVHAFLQEHGACSCKVDEKM